MSPWGDALAESAPAIAAQQIALTGRMACRSNETKLSRGYLRTRLRCSEINLITFRQVNKAGSRRLQRLVRRLPLRPVLGRSLLELLVVDSLGKVASFTDTVSISGEPRQLLFCARLTMIGDRCALISKIGKLLA